MATYEVAVPFGALLYQSLNGTSTTELPDTFELPGLAVTRKMSGQYVAVVQVAAQRLEQAKVVAVQQVRDALRVFATFNSGFLVDYSQGVEAHRLDEEPLPSTTRHIDDDGHAHFAVTATASVEVSTSVSVIQRRVSLDVEARALAWRAEWPEWLATTLELNYLAVTSQETIPRLISLYSALEVMTKGLLGVQESVFAGYQQKKPLLRDLWAVLERYDLHGDLIERVLQQVENTQPQSQIDRIATALGLIGVEASHADIRSVTRIRAAVAHRGRSSDDSALRHAMDRVSGWVQTGLRNVLEGQRTHGPASDGPEHGVGEAS